MNQALIDQIVQAVLYEGYILYPYRASARKNRQRFTFGRVYPEAYSAAQGGREPCAMQTQCLVKASGPGAAVEVIVRFLHPTIREIGELRPGGTSAASALEAPELGHPDHYTVVSELRVDEALHQSWQEAVEREVRLPIREISGGFAAVKIPFAFPASRTVEPIRNKAGGIAGAIIRLQEALHGFVELGAEPVDAEVLRITVRIVNQTVVDAAAMVGDAAIVRRTFASTHTIFHALNAELISQIDPPVAYAEAVAACRQSGTWPILVGDEEKQERDTMISSPIILYDYPKIAPESPGTLFDGGEIDEILTLRILTMTDDEKKEMRGVDEQARRILERTETLKQEQLLDMHGAMREEVSAAGRHPELVEGSVQTPSERRGGNGPQGRGESLDLSNEAFFNPANKPASFVLGGVPMKKGDRVRVRPKSRADIMDMAIAGKIAIIEAIEQDAEDRVHLALVMEDDPGRDLGFLRQPGHRFFYTTDEVEPLREGE